MGRLTLNLVLSFAQFEREVVGERIRDKIRGRVADPITGGAVLEYGPTEILSPVSPMLPRPVCLCRPRRSSRLGHRGKPWLLDLERRIPARDRFAPDSPLEGTGFEPSVP